MKIRNRLYISAAISIALAIILVVTVGLSSNRVTQEMEKRSLAMDMNTAVLELDIITYEYLLHREKQMEQQWILRYTSMEEILEEAVKNLRVPLSILSSYTSFYDSFSQITVNSKEIQRLTQEGASQQEIDIALRLEEELVAQLLVTSQSLATDASRVAEEAYAEATEAQRLATRLTLILMIILTITVMTLSLRVARSISRPLDELIKGTRIISKGDLEHRVEVRNKDELGELTTAFNQMTENLCRDITERKRAEEELEKHREHLEVLVEERTRELRKAQEELMRSERLATLGQFSGSISHELRNPLGVIDSSVYYLKSKLKGLDEKTLEHLDRIRSSVSSSTTIIESLLNLTRMKVPQLEKLDLTALTSDAIDTSRVPASVRIVKDFPEQEVTVNADGEQLRMAFENVVENAVQAMDSKGMLTVTVRVTDAGQAEVSFADTGPGIAPENLSRVFEPLFSTKARGIGFGLSIVKMIIDKHGGMVTAESESGKGAAIIIHLPLYSGENKEGIRND